MYIRNKYVYIYNIYLCMIYTIRTYHTQYVYTLYAAHSQGKFLNISLSWICEPRFEAIRQLENDACTVLCDICHNDIHWAYHTDLQYEWIRDFPARQCWSVLFWVQVFKSARSRKWIWELVKKHIDKLGQFIQPLFFLDLCRDKHDLQNLL